MSKNISFSILAVIILIQVIFSFFYSSEIINQNNLLNTNQEAFNVLKKENQNLEIKLSQLSSLQNLNEQLKDKNYSSIKQEINLDKP